MDEILSYILKEAGPVGATVAIMYLWLRSVLKDRNVAYERLVEIQDKYEQLNREQIQQLEKQVETISKLHELLKNK